VQLSIPNAGSLELCTFRACSLQRLLGKFYSEFFWGILTDFQVGFPPSLQQFVFGRETQGTMRPEVEQELAHTLLVELLAYQFASPVRWIETQDVILAEKTTERIVEIGPADTLGVMAKRTLGSKYEAYDAAKSVQRQILCYNKDAKEIYYDVDPIVDEPTPADTNATPTQSAPAAALPVASASPPSSAGPAVQVPDAPVGAVDIIRALIAQKLKKPLLDVPLGKAIKDLVGGKHPFSNLEFFIH
jgi:fatty acid synthase subunit alpha, fungi type